MRTPPLAYRRRRGVREPASLRQQLFRTLCLISVLPMLIVILFGYGSWYLYALDTVRAGVRQSLHQANESLNSLLAQVEDIVLGVVINTNMMRMMSDSRLPTDSALREGVYNELSSILLTNSRVINAIYAETPQTMIFSRLNSNDTHSVYKLGLYGTEYEQLVMNLHSGSYWMDGADVDAVSGKPNQGGVSTIRCAAALPNIDRKGFCGMLSVMLRASTLRGIIGDMYADLDGARTLVVDRNGQEIVGVGEVDEALFAQALALINRSEASGSVSIDGQKLEISAVENEKTGWRLICVIPTSAMTGSVIHNAMISLIGCFALAILCIYLSVRLTRRFTQTFQPLLKTIGRIEQGDLDARVPEMNTREMVAVGRVFNHMMNRYDEQVQRNALQQSALLRAQLSALQGQLSSHFLYNTLDAINWSLIERGENDISASVVKLGSLLRYSLDSAGDTVQLSRELEAVTCYLDICKLRFEDRLRFSIDVDSRFLLISVPRFMLQPLVENGIVHGCEKSGGQVTLSLRGFIEGAFFVIEVFNSGSSFPQDVIERLQREHDLPLRQRAHIGLSNVADRLKTLYGDAYTMRVCNLPGEGALVRLQLPAPDGKEDP